MDIADFEARKREHIRESLNPEHQAKGLGGFESIHLIHEAFPELDFDAVALADTSLQRKIARPFYVAGMTAGHEDAPRINRTLAQACADRGWAMGVGSQRRELEAVLSDSGDSWREIREQVPGLELFANLGISQLIRAETAQVRRLVDSIRASALCIHANALQEAIQPGGTPQFKGALRALERLTSEIGVPVVLKETGCGFSRATLLRLKDVGLAAIDVSGLGGTHWGRIEGARAPGGSPSALASATFRNWGESTVDSVLAARSVGETPEIWASGGVRSGLDAARLIALGARRVGYAQPALEAALQGQAALASWMETQEFELRLALFCTGSATPEALRRKENAWHRKAV